MHITLTPDRIILTEILSMFGLDYDSLPISLSPDETGSWMKVDLSPKALDMIRDRIKFRLEAAELAEDALHSSRELVKSMEARLVPAVEADGMQFESDYM